MFWVFSRHVPRVPAKALHRYGSSGLLVPQVFWPAQRVLMGAVEACAGSVIRDACQQQAGMLVSSHILLLQVFLGRLRESEMERLHERISSAVMETCLAMTIFREDFNVESVAMFVMLTFVKVQPLPWQVPSSLGQASLGVDILTSCLQHLSMVPRCAAM